MAGASGFIPLTEELVARQLAKCLSQQSNAVTPDESDVSDLTGWINRYGERPWDQASIHAYREEQKRIRAQRVILDKAATILREDSVHWRRYFDRPDHQGSSPDMMGLVVDRANEIETALRVLARPRSGFEFYGLPQMADRGPDVQPYVLSAVVLAGETLAAINRARHRAKRPMLKSIGNEDGPIMIFVRQMLVSIYGPVVPKRATLLEAIRNFRRRL